MPSEKRARQRAAREARLAAQAKATKRRKQVRNYVIVGVIAAIIVGIVFLTSSNNPKKGSATTTTTAAKGATTTTVPSTTSTTVAGSTTTTVPTIAAIPAADLSPAGTAGKAPTVVVPPGSPPTQLESADLITGTGPAAKTGDALTVQYVLATYSSRKTVQSSWTSQPFSFTLGQGVIQGWDVGVVGMKVGGRRELIVPPSLGYGSTAQGPGIAANDTLVFTIDLVKVG